MASPQLEQGFTRIANEILEKIISNRDLSAKELRIVFHVIRKTYGFEKKKDWISISQFLKAVGGDRSSMCRTLRKLVACRLLLKTNKDYGFNKNWEQWVVAPKPLVAKRSMGSGRAVNGVVAHRPPTKETITKETNTKETSVAKAPQEDLRKIVNKYFDLQSYEEADRKASFPRHVRDAKALLQACGGDSGRAVAVLDALHAWAAGKHLSYSIGTALKQWQRFSRSEPASTYEAKMARVQAEIDKYSKQTP